MTKTPGYYGPTWDKSNRRWTVERKSDRKTFHFFSEEAANKWLTDPEAYPKLPLSHVYSAKQRASALSRQRTNT